MGSEKGGDVEVRCKECGAVMELRVKAPPYGLAGQAFHVIGARLCGPLAPTSDKRSTEPDPLPPRKET